MPLIKPKIANKPAVRTSARTGGVKFQYRARTPEEVRERAQRQIGGRDSYFNQEVPFFTPAEGNNTVRILPPPPDADWRHYGLTLAVHYDIGADKSSYVCPAKSGKGDCPICEERDRANNAGEGDFAASLRPSYRVAVYVINRKAENEGPQLWNMPAGLDKDIVKLTIDPTTGEILPVDDPNDGYDLTFVRTGTGLKTKYGGIQFSRKASPLADDEDTANAWLQYIMDHRIDECLIHYDADHIAKVFSGQAPASTDDDDVDKAPARPAAKAPAKTAAAKTPAHAVKPPARPAIKPKAKEPEPDPAEPDLPTWAEMLDLDEDGLAALGEAQQLEFPEEGFEGIDELRIWIAESIGVTVEEAEAEEEAPAPKSAAPASWRDRLKKPGK